MRLIKNKKPGRCPVFRCRNLPRNIKDHPKSCQLCGSHAKELWRIRNPVHAAYGALKVSARRRGIPFTLTFEHFSEIAEATRYIDNKGNYRHNLHIDRIEEHLGYTDGNIQVITCGENVAKEHRRRLVDQKIRRYEEEHDADDSGLEHVPQEGDPF